MAQSVELLFDAQAEAALRAQWARLAAAGLPSEQRSAPSTHHRPHLTLFAADTISATAEDALPAAVAGLDLELQVASTLLFGPRRGSCILVRQVAATVELLTVQRRVAELCGADPYGQFGPGRWSPHVTLARRVPLEALGAALQALGAEVVRGTVTSCRRWDGDRRRAWSIG